MGLFDGYFDPEQFGEGGGLLGRLLSLQQNQALYQPSADRDQAPLPQPMAWRVPPSHGQPSSDP